MLFLTLLKKNALRILENFISFDRGKENLDVDGARVLRDSLQRTREGYPGYRELSNGRVLRRETRTLDPFDNGCQPPRILDPAGFIINLLHLLLLLADFVNPLLPPSSAKSVDKLDASSASNYEYNPVNRKQDKVGKCFLTDRFKST